MPNEFQPGGAKIPKTEPAQTATPTVPQQRTPQKPIPTVRIAIYLLIGLAALGVVSNIARLGSRVAPKLPKSPQTAKPSTLSPDAVASFQAQEQEQVRKLQAENEEAQRLLDKTAATAQSLGGQPPLTMMPCTPSLAGTQGTSASGSPITCEADGQWHPSAEANGIPAMSAAQRQALYGRQTGGHQSDPEQSARQHRLEALNSSSVAIDFSNAAAAETPVKRGAEMNPPTETAMPSGASEEERASVRPIDVSDHVDGKDAKRAKYDWDRYTGKLYRIFEGTVLETVLTNRINGSFAGPIDTMVTTDVWSHDHQRLLIPQGTRCLGTVSAVSGSNQQRLYVAFHRCIMPDGYSLDLDKFVGLNQMGETALRDLVNHHYFQIFGASLAVGALGGLAQVGNSYSGFGYNPAVSIRNGISQEMGQESTQILDRFLNQLPTFIVRERSRVRIYLSSDLEVPAYEAHEIDPPL